MRRRPRPEGLRHRARTGAGHRTTTGRRDWREEAGKRATIPGQSNPVLDHGASRSAGQIMETGRPHPAPGDQRHRHRHCTPIRCSACSAHFTNKPISSTMTRKWRRSTLFHGRGANWPPACLRAGNHDIESRLFASMICPRRLGVGRKRCVPFQALLSTREVPRPGNRPHWHDKERACHPAVKPRDNDIWQNALSGWAARLSGVGVIHAGWLSAVFVTSSSVLSAI